ncbi:MAG: adenylate/guanylate cyclase domain-containing protein [candidate division WOR-3 bacterium]
MIKRKIRNEIAFTFSLIVFFTTFFLTLILAKINTDSLTLSAKEYAVAISDEIKKDLFQKTEIIEEALNYVIDIFNDNALNIEKKIEYVKIYLSFEPNINYIGIYDVNGRLIDQFSSPKYGILKDITDKIKIIRSDSTFYSLYYSEKDSFPVLEAIKKWKTSDNRLIGYLSAGFSLSYLSSYLKELSFRRFNIYDLIFILDKNGNVIAHPEIKFVKEKKKLKEIGFFKNFENSKEILKFDIAFSQNYIDYKNRKLLGTFTTLPSLEWGIVVSQPHEIVYASLRRLYTFSSLTGFIFLFLSIIFGILSSRYLTKPIEELNLGIKRIISRDFGYQVNVRAKNEIGELANSFNEMIKTLKHYKEEIIKETEIKLFAMRYLPTHLANQLIAQGKSTLSAETIKREISIMFADISNFTSLSEKFSPEKLVSYLNKYFNIATESIFKYNGVIDKFIGDCVMALFGVPYVSINAAEEAVKSAIDLIKNILMKNEEFEKEFGFGIRVKIGISTGDVVVGNIGSKTRLDYTAIGKAVNLASRFEELALDNEIIIDESTKNKLPSIIKIEEIGYMKIKGIKENVKCYRVIL